MLTKISALFYGWRMIALGCAIRVLGGGFHLYGFTVFFLPLSQELGLSRAATSLAFSLARAEGAIEGPFSGYFIDRFGPRPIVLTAMILSGAGYMLLSTVNSYPAFLAVYVGVISLSFSAGFMHSPMVLANTWFIRRRAFAMTLISASISLGGALVTPLLSMSVFALGWRSGALFAGIGLLVIGIPLALFLRRSPESMGLMPDGALQPKPDAAGRISAFTGGSAIDETHFSLSQAMRTTAFWMMILATTVRVAAFGTVMVHFIPILVWKGLSEQRAALLLAIFAFTSIPTHLLLGWLGDRVNKPRLMAVSMLVGTVGLASLVFGESEWPLWLFAILFTSVEAIFPVSWATVGEYFGRKSFATIRGTMSSLYMWGGVLGPVAAGAIFDRSQSYAPVMIVLLPLFLLAALFYGLLVQPHPRQT